MDRRIGPELVDGAGLAEILARRSEHHDKFRRASIATPYVTEPGLERLLPLLAEPKKARTELRLLVRNDPVSIATGALSLEALRRALERPARGGSSTEIRSTSSLHAKIYLLEPGFVCAIGSSNLTGAGLGGENDELNAVWQGSRKAFATAEAKFQHLWKRADPLDAGTVDQMERLEELPTFKAFRRLFERIQRIKELPVLSKEGAEHQSYPILRQLARRTRLAKKGWTWNKASGWLKTQSKGEGDRGYRLESLAAAGLFRKDDEFIRLTQEGQRVCDDPTAALEWLTRQYPLVDRVLHQVAAQKGISYSALAETLNVEKQRIQRCMWWLGSLGLVRKVGGGGGGEAQWHLEDKKKRSAKRPEPTGGREGNPRVPR